MSGPPLARRSRRVTSPGHTPLFSHLSSASRRTNTITRFAVIHSGFPAPRNMHLRQQYQMLNSKRITIKFWIKVWRVWPCEGLRTECHYVRWDYVFILLCLFIISWGGRRADKGDLSRSRSQAGEGVPETLPEMCGDQTCEPCLTMFDDVVKGGHRQAFLCLVETQETRRCSALAGHLD